MKKLFALFLLSAIGIAFYACSTTCGLPPEDARGNPSVIQYPNK